MCIRDRRLKRATDAEELTASQLAELEAMPASSKRVTGACATEILMREIREFGRYPKRQQVDIKENALAERLRHFHRKKLLSASQLAELEQMPRTEPRDGCQQKAERPEILMEEIRALGHLPRRTKGHEDEFALYERFWRAKHNSQLSESQLAELAELPGCESREVRTAARLDALMAEIRALGHIPRCKVETLLYSRLYWARRQGQLNGSQLAELKQLALMTDIRALGHIPRSQHENALYIL